MLKYSIITCVKNGEKDISRCLNSVDNLKSSNFEHIVFDGKSDDKTLSIIQDVPKKYRTIISQKDDGLYDALNQSIGMARGKYIILLHADDVFASPTVLTDIDTHLEQNKDPKIIVCNIKILNPKNRMVRRWVAQSFHWVGLLNGWSPPHTGLVIERQLYQRSLPFATSYSISSDYDFTIRLLKKYPRYSFLKIDLVHMTSGGMSTSPNNAIKTLLQDINISRANGLRPWAPYLKRILKITQFV